MRDTREDILIDLRWPQSSGTTLAGAVCGQQVLMPTGEADRDGNPCVAALVFDGDTRGVFTSNAVVELAMELGYKRQYDHIDDDTSDAEDYLNELTPDGYAFGFDDGSFYLANDAWWSMVSE